MIKKIITICLLAVLSFGLKGQSFDFMSSGSPGKPYSFAIYNGLKTDTIAKGITTAQGKASIKIPKKYQGIPAMGSLAVEGQKNIDIILNGETFRLTIGSGKLLFENSLENDLLHNKQQDVFLTPHGGTFAQAYFKIETAVMQVAEVVNLMQKGRGDVFKQGTARISSLNVDVDKLYYSKYWYFIIDGLLRLSIGEEGFANDMIRLLDKTKSEKVYIAFVEDLIMLTNQFGMDDAFDQVITHVEKSGRIKHPQGNIYDAFAMAKIKRGTVAPALKGLTPALGKTSHRYTILFFHQPECENCAEQLNKLRKNYNFYKQKNIRVVTLSGALDEASFRNESKSFLWNDKLCDFKGFAGGYFREYGVMGTPTIYLLDKEAVVLKRFALLSEVEMYVRGLE